MLAGWKMDIDSKSHICFPKFCIESNSHKKKEMRLTSSSTRPGSSSAIWSSASASRSTTRRSGWSAASGSSGDDDGDGNGWSPALPILQAADRSVSVTPAEPTCKKWREKKLWLDFHVAKQTRDISSINLTPMKKKERKNKWLTNQLGLERGKVSF